MSDIPQSPLQSRYYSPQGPHLRGYLHPFAVLGTDCAIGKRTTGTILTDPE